MFDKYCVNIYALPDICQYPLRLARTFFYSKYNPHTKTLPFIVWMSNAFKRFLNIDNDPLIDAVGLKREML